MSNPWEEVNLQMGFVEFLAQIGIRFNTFLDSLHRIGSKTVFWVILLREFSMQTIKGRVDSTLYVCCFPHKAITNSINRYKNVLNGYEKEMLRLNADGMVE